MLQHILDGGGGDGGGSSTTTTGTGAATAQGAYCGTDPDTSATLCLGNTLCSGILIDQEAYPRCGFRISGNALDVECSCGGFLCPLGAAATCDDLETLLANSNEGTVCSQLGGGTCTQGTPMSTSTTSGGGTCDPVCRSECGGDPTCIQLCGC